ncbi:MAG TPA: glycosyltransferase [Clostridia bacterium]|nr:glycosyltransferase [Clostridia bacterium]
MKLVIFGLTVSSSWGNGHATLWRALCRALGKRGHQVLFFERNVPYYAAHRDLTDLPGGTLILYPDWESVLPKARMELSDADVGMITSYCPDGLQATDLLLASSARSKVFYDLDTPVTLSLLRAGKPVAYLGPRRLEDFDLVLSYTGGVALERLQSELGARRVAPLYGSVDPASHFPVAPVESYRADLSYLGTYAEDRQAAVEQFLIKPARHLPDKKFVIGGAQYPEDFPWTRNIFFVRHLPPSEHPAFYCSSRLTLNVTRQAMAEMGFCPSGRLFEAAACGVPILSDWWQGLDEFFAPGRQILLAHTTQDALNALECSDAQLAAMAAEARERTMVEHTADRRAADLEQVVEQLWHQPDKGEILAGAQ